ncbi:[heparan sulfate]-glucosamine N-sulfotransferase [Aureococcus anophagefferens]|nr:[heparan sulfate]-glucosamine N-sulfotransferase [Aureococcus anophagefferens]
MRRAAAVVLVSLLARAGAPPVEGETPEEAEARKARERKEVEVDMLAMHHWRGPAASRRAAAGADVFPARRFCDQPANADMYLCDAFRDYLAGTPESEMAKKRPHPNPASEQISTMHAPPAPARAPRRAAATRRPRAGAHAALARRRGAVHDARARAARRRRRGPGVAAVSARVRLARVACGDATAAQDRSAGPRRFVLDGAPNARRRAADAGACVAGGGRAGVARAALSFLAGGADAEKSLRCLPTFLIVGAQKAATGSLSDWLSRHPALRRGDGPAAHRREVHYFDQLPGNGSDTAALEATWRDYLRASGGHHARHGRFYEVSRPLPRSPAGAVVSAAPRRGCFRAAWTLDEAEGYAATARPRRPIAAAARRGLRAGDLRRLRPRRDRREALPPGAAGAGRGRRRAGADALRAAGCPLG